MKIPYTRKNRCGVYFIRLLIPLKARQNIPELKREYLFSLRTKLKSEAAFKAAILTAEFYKLSKYVQALSDKEIVTNKQFVIKLYSKIMNLKTGYIFKLTDDGVHIETEGDTPEERTEDHRQALEMAKTIKEIIPQARVSKEASSAPLKLPVDEKKSMTIKEVKDKFFSYYLDERSVNGQLQIKQKTADAYERLLCEMAVIIGIDTEVSRVNPSFMDDSVKRLKNGVSDDKFIRLRDKFKSMIEYGNQREIWDIKHVDGYFPSQKLKYRRKNDIKRKPFDEDDLQGLLKGIVFNTSAESHKRPEPYHYWYFLTMMFTGARPQEIGQLRVQSIVADPDTGI